MKNILLNRKHFLNQSSRSPTAPRKKCFRPDQYVEARTMKFNGFRILHSNHFPGGPTQKKVSGDVKIKIFKGNVIVLGRKSQNSLYNNSLVSFDEKGDYDQKDAEGFIKINSIRLKNLK